LTGSKDIMKIKRVNRHTD